MTKRSAEKALRDEVRAASEEVAARTRVLETERKRTTAALDRRRIADEAVARATARRDRAQAALDALLPLPLPGDDVVDVAPDDEVGQLAAPLTDEELAEGAAIVDEATAAAAPTPIRPSKRA